jgi:predicted RND superfamily exporter protein
MEGYIRFIEKYARWVLFILLLITLLFAWKITDLTEDSNPYIPNKPQDAGLST